MGSKFFRLSIVLVMLMAAVLVAAPAASAAPPAPAAVPGRYVVTAKSAADYQALLADVQNAGGAVVMQMPQTNMLVVTGNPAMRQAIGKSAHTTRVTNDRVEKLILPEGVKLTTSPELQRQAMTGPGKGPAITPDPAFSLPGLMWNMDRIFAPKAWKYNAGDPTVLVGVADTGLDFTHSELKPQIVDVVDLTTTEDPPLCSYYYGVSDAELGAYYGAPATTDWNGHGSWIGGNIAGALDGVGINGAAPKVKLVALKISQWCGSAYDSTILNAFTYAADHGIDVVSISFGGYLDRRDPEQNSIYMNYVATVQYAMRKGTVIVAAAGNEHLRIGPGGIVQSHGPLTTPGTTFEDYFGLWENPGGIPGVIDVSSTGNVVAASSATCPAGTTGPTATCKPASDAHQAPGTGMQNQLAYYSNYGPRIDLAGPGGARKFNLPVWDRGGTPGFPVTTADGTTAYQTFSITSNWATQIPCYYWGAGNGVFYPGECYSTIQGTSMATPHVSAVFAIAASAHPEMRHKVGRLVSFVEANADKSSHNTTQPLSKTDTSPGDQSGVACTTGYCHLGGAAIPDSEAYGKGIANAAAVAR